MPHPKLQGDGCRGKEDVGTTETVLVDPAGWVPPESTEWDASFLGGGVFVVGGAAVLWALLVLGAARRTLRSGKTSAFVATPELRRRAPGCVGWSTGRPSRGSFRSSR